MKNKNLTKFDNLVQNIYEKYDIELPKNFNPRSVDSCMYAAELLTKKLLDQGLNNFIVIEGYVKIKNVEGRFQHTWIQTKGEKIDPTIKQFFSKDDSDEYIESRVQYVVKTKYSPEDYLKLCLEYPIDPSKHFVKDQDPM